MMKCGHTGNAEHNGRPCCLICAPDPRAFEIDENIPNLEGREAKCNECGHKARSNINLPFFKYCPDSEYDSFYCGCCGWG